MLNIIDININELTHYENNAKIHTKEQIEQIKSSILKFGNNDPIGIWGDKNIIVEGHGRAIALKELGYETVECIRLDHLTDEERKAYTLIHNKTTMNTDFDFAKLEEELLNIQNIDMSMFEFDIDTDIIPEDDDFDIEEALEEIEEPITSYGDIYLLGNHKLICGDSTNKDDVNLLMGDKQADLLLTDPPYNVNVSNSEGMTIKNDNMKDSEFKQFLHKAFNNASTHLKKGGAFYIWHGDSETVNFRNACNNNELTVRQCLIWVKNGMILGRQDYNWKHEPCLYGWKDGASHYFIEDYTQETVIEDKIDINKLKKDEMKALIKELLEDKVPTTIIREDKPLKNTDHPTMKPIKLIARQIKNSSKKGEIVLDLFGGSGSTLIAAEQLDRTCYMVEYDPRYAQVIIDRYIKLKGNDEDVFLLKEDGEKVPYSTLK